MLHHVEPNCWTLLLPRGHHHEWICQCVPIDSIWSRRSHFPTRWGPSPFWCHCTVAVFFRTVLNNLSIYWSNYWTFIIILFYRLINCIYLYIWYIIGHQWSHDIEYYNVVLLCLALAMRCLSGTFEKSRRQFVASLTALYSHKFPNSEFESDTTQAECIAHVGRDFVRARQPNLY
jgi:hypothetical protein